MERRVWRKLSTTVIGIAGLVALGLQPAVAAPTRYDVSTLMGKVASVNGTAGLQIRMSAFIQEEADLTSDPYGALATDGATLSGDPSGVTAPDVTVNGDTAGAPQNETSIAVDPNNPNRIVGSANDYVTRTWPCSSGGQPCSALGDGYSGTYYSNDGGAHWCCTSSDPTHLGTIIPGVDRLAGGSYDAGGDPAVAFDSHGDVYYSGLGFDRASAPNTVTVNKGTFNASGSLSWSAPTFINATTSPAVFNDKEWIAADSNASSRFRDRVYLTWTRFVFNPANGNYVESPINFAYSADAGKTFSSPQLISGNVLYGQGSHPIVGPDGTLYVFWDGAQRLSTYDSTWMVKSTDGGVSWSKPTAITPLADISGPRNTAFRVNSYPSATIGPDGSLYAVWSSMIANDATAYGVSAFGYSAAFHAQTVYSVSHDGGTTWSTPQFVLGAARTAVGYPVTQPDKTSLLAPADRPADSLFPSVSAAPNGNVYVGAYVADVVSPWQSCLAYDPNGSVNCVKTGIYINNAKLDYVVTDLSTGVTQTMTTHPINTRYNFRGSFIGDYTEIAAGPDSTVHAMWTDTNNQQTIDWWYGYNFNGLLANQQDVVTAPGNF